MFQKDKVLSPSQELSGEVLPGLQVFLEKMCLRGSHDTDIREAVHQWGTPFPGDGVLGLPSPCTEWRDRDKGFHSNTCPQGMMSAQY